ncbi:Helicase conserved C-terminal domain [Phytophthora infestans]|uniref:ATP-dependent RNA helicase n=1 Tax=Phytophthora infestans TaxID=4787 RepID=A0A833W905_PHYIN|nr:Helicase conserved C-terminal domain [Phytophthora infestans]KAF4139471.1 Helicase conserved C-terminal domain [Phytophthora infestans]
MWTCRRLSSHLSTTARGFRSSCIPWASTGSHLSDVSFASLPISQRSKDVLTRDMGYEFLTHVQNDTLPLVLDGRDVLAKGKTGNGKTIAFLLPTLERMLTHPQPKQDKISALVISPTRELAQQIAVEAVKLTNAHGLRTSCFVGGSAVNKDVKELTQSGGIDVLVSTPGRLQAHLEDNSGRIRQKLDSLQVLVLDEADRLLDMGFRPDIMRIISHLPKERQTLLFSATLPAATEELKDVALLDDYVFVDTIEGDDQQTNTQAVQEYVVCDLQDVIPVVEGILEEHMKLPAYKVIVFLPTARSAQFMAQLFQSAGFQNVLEMHSRKSQSARTKAADAFRKGKKMIMFSSDVSARGVDYPDVSLVLQVGLTDRDQYIHRLGRTARAGMEGRGILVLADFEKVMLRDLADLPLTELEQRPQLDQQNYRTTRALANVRQRSELEQSAEKAYAAFLGFYNSNLKKLKMSKTKLVETGALYSQLIGLEKVPSLQKKTLRAMGLMDTPGLTIASKPVRGRESKAKGQGELDRFGSENRNGYQSLHSRKKKVDRSSSLWRSYNDKEAKPFQSEQSFKSNRSRSASPSTKRESRSHGHKRSASSATKRNYKEPHKRYYKNDR